MFHHSFSRAIAFQSTLMEGHSHRVHTEKWQSMDISKRPEAETYELVNSMFQVGMPSENLDYYRQEIKPNLPWADRHFELERVSGLPINPGTTWKEWPYALSADKFQSKTGYFSHTYAERYWPKIAGSDPNPPPGFEIVQNAGIRYSYGDLKDVVELLRREPLTRQAYLPVWFPEDTGVVHGERVPCTLGYHFLMRGNSLNIAYFIRSCDFVRHFRDDLYLTVRLLLWVLDELRKGERNELWMDVKPGTFTFWAGSLHMFLNDYRMLYAKKGQ